MFPRALLFTVAVMVAEISPAAPGRVFEDQPRGPWQTGTFEELWVDEQRDEIFTSDAADKRHLMIQVWYPAAFAGNPPRALYVLRREIYPPGGLTEWRLWLNDVKEVRTTSVVDAPVAPRPSRFPVLLYQPGNTNPHFSGTFQTEFLASHGYVVVAIGRPEPFIGETPLPDDYFPDGYRYRQDRNPDSAAFWSHLLADIRFVLDRLQALDAGTDSRFSGRLDLERIGALGWSAGGNLSFYAAGHEPRIKAAVNLDNCRIGCGNYPQRIRPPILFMHADVRDELDWLARKVPQWDASRRERWVSEGADDWYTQYYARAESDWYDVTLRGRTVHSHFSDRILFDLPPKPEQMPARQAHEIINAFVLEFFDRYLRESPHSPLLSGKQAHPQTELFGSQRP